MARARVLVLSPALALALGALGACGGSSGTPTAAPTTPPLVTPAESTTASLGPATTIGVIGDWGKDTPATRRVVAMMRGWSASAVVTTGDNAYQSGTVAEAATARRLIAPLLSGGARLIASLGNHDERTLTGRPTMAALGIPARWYTAVAGPVQLVVLDANAPADPDQLAFLRRVLASKRTVPFRVAVFHQPAAACSLHRAEPLVVKHWMQLLDNGRAGVDLVLSGHNHTYERFVTSKGLPLITTGGGGAELYKSFRYLCTGPATPKVLRTVYNAVRITARSGALDVGAYAVDGTRIDSLTVTPAR